MLDVMEPVFEAHGFTFVQYQVLAWLRDGIAVNPKDICAQYRHDSGALTRVIDQLAERGLLERVRRDRDRRKVELQLTPAGREVIESLMPLVVDKLNLALAEFSSEEVQELMRLLIKLNVTLANRPSSLPRAWRLRRPYAHHESHLLLGAALLAGCVLPPKESPHPQSLGTAIGSGLTGVAAEPVADGWWNSFQDPQLDRLIRAGLKDNPTLAAGAGAGGGGAGADAIGAVEFAAACAISMPARCISGRLRTISSRRRSPGTASGWARPAPPWVGTSISGVGRRLRCIARRRSRNPRSMDEDNARLLLAGAIAQAYVELYREYALADIAERSEAQRQNIVNITRRRVAAGLDTRLELRQAEGQLPQARVARAQAQAAADLAIHQLAVLTGQGADGYASIARPAFNRRCGVAGAHGAAHQSAGAPARRAVRAPERRRPPTRSASADKAAFYPDVNLQALAGFGAFGLNNLVQWSARGYGAGPVISLPLFDGGRLRAQYRGSEAQLDAADRRLQRHRAACRAADRRSNHAARRAGARTHRSAANARGQ